MLYSKKLTFFIDYYAISVIFADINNLFTINAL